MTTLRNDDWQNVVDHQTAYMHTDDDVQAADVAAWMQAHPDAVQNWRRFRAAALWFGALCVFAVGFWTMLFYAGVYGETNDPHSLAGAMVGGLVMCAVFAWAVERQRKAVGK